MPVQAGFEALYFGRIDYQDRAKRTAESDMEMVWRASRSLEERAQIFTGDSFFVVVVVCALSRINYSESTLTRRFFAAPCFYGSRQGHFGSILFLF